MVASAPVASVAPVVVVTVPVVGFRLGLDEEILREDSLAPLANLLPEATFWWHACCLASRASRHCRVAASKAQGDSNVLHLRLVSAAVRRCEAALQCGDELRVGGGHHWGEAGGGQGWGDRCDDTTAMMTACSRGGKRFRSPWPEKPSRGVYSPPAK